MVTFPGAFAVTFPSLTEAIFSSLEDHSTVSVLDSSGDKVATRTSLDPTSKVMFFFDNSMFVDFNGLEYKIEKMEVDYANKEMIMISGVRIT